MHLQHLQGAQKHLTLVSHWLPIRSNSGLLSCPRTLKHADGLTRTANLSIINLQPHQFDLCGVELLCVPTRSSLLALIVSTITWCFHAVGLFTRPEPVYLVPHKISKTLVVSMPFVWFSSNLLPVRI